LLFSQDDFQNFNQSEIKKDLLNLSPKIKILVGILEGYLKEKNFNNLLPFDSYLQPPNILKFECADIYKEIVETEEVILEWQTENAKEVSIEGIGKVSGNGTQKVILNKGTTFLLKASGYFKEVISNPISIKVHPLPVINVFKPLKEKITKGESTQIMWQVSNAESIFLNGEDVTNKTKKGNGFSPMTPDKTSQYILEVHSFQSRKIIKSKTEIKIFSPVRVISFDVNKSFTIQTKPVTLFWDVINSNKLVIEPEIGDVTGLTEKEIFPIKSTTYRLIATNDLHKDNLKTCRVEVLPLPQIVSVQFPQPPKIAINSQPNIKLNTAINMSNLISLMPNKLVRDVSSFPSLKFISHPFALLIEFLRKEINIHTLIRKNKIKY
jgi:hypothetical protein